MKPQQKCSDKNSSEPVSSGHDLDDSAAVVEDRSFKQNQSASSFSTLTGFTQLPNSLWKTLGVCLLHKSINFYMYSAKSQPKAVVKSFVQLERKKKTQLEP